MRSASRRPQSASASGSSAASFFSASAQIWVSRGLVPEDGLDLRQELGSGGGAGLPSLPVGRLRLQGPVRLAADADAGHPEPPLFATLEWVDWFNNRRLLEPIGNIPPAEFEELYWQSQEAPALVAGLT